MSLFSHFCRSSHQWQSCDWETWWHICGEAPNSAPCPCGPIPGLNVSQIHQNSTSWVHANLCFVSNPIAASSQVPPPMCRRCSSWQYLCLCRRLFIIFSFVSFFMNSYCFHSIISLSSCTPPRIWTWTNTGDMISLLPSHDANDINLLTTPISQACVCAVTKDAYTWHLACLIPFISRYPNQACHDYMCHITEWKVCICWQVYEG